MSEGAPAPDRGAEINVPVARPLLGSPFATNTRPPISSFTMSPRNQMRGANRATRARETEKFVGILLVTTRPVPGEISKRSPVHGPIIPTGPRQEPEICRNTNLIVPGLEACADEKSKPPKFSSTLANRNFSYRMLAWNVPNSQFGL